MSDLHSLPLTGHDIPYRPVIRAKVYGVRMLSGETKWFWCYLDGHKAVTAHGPFEDWRETYDSARRMVELL